MFLVVLANLTAISFSTYILAHYMTRAVPMEHPGMFKTMFIVLQVPVWGINNYLITPGIAQLDILILFLSISLSGIFAKKGFRVKACIYMLAFLAAQILENYLLNLVFFPAAAIPRAGAGYSEPPGQNLRRQLSSGVWRRGIHRHPDPSFPREIGQHRTIWQEAPAWIFGSIQSLENEGILYVFLVFQTEEVGQKDGCGSQTQLRGVALSKPIRKPKIRSTQTDAPDSFLAAPFGGNLLNLSRTDTWLPRWGSCQAERPD